MKLINNSWVQLSLRQKANRPDVIPDIIFCISLYVGWNSLPHSRTKTWTFLLLHQRNCGGRHNRWSHLGWGYRLALDLTVHMVPLIAWIPFLKVLTKSIAKEKLAQNICIPYNLGHLWFHGDYCRSDSENPYLNGSSDHRHHPYYREYPNYSSANR